MRINTFLGSSLKPIIIYIQSILIQLFNIPIAVIIGKIIILLFCVSSRILAQEKFRCTEFSYTAHKTFSEDFCGDKSNPIKWCAFSHTNQTRNVSPRCSPLNRCAKLFTAQQRIAKGATYAHRHTISRWQRNNNTAAHSILDKINNNVISMLLAHERGGVGCGGGGGRTTM